MNAQTETLSYRTSAAMTAGSGLQTTLSNFSTCQTSVSATFTAVGFSGSWSNGNFDYYVNNVLIGSGVGTQTFDISAYIPITSVRIVKTNYNNWNEVYINVNVTSLSSSMPASGPSVSNVTYVQGSTASPLSATLTGTGTTLKWYTTTLGDNYSATGPTPSTATIGTTSYFVAQADASGCESLRSEIVVTVVPNTPATHLNFDGVNDAITVTGVNFPLGNTSRTIEAWIKTTQNNGGGAIMTYGNLTTNNRFALYQTGGKLNFVAENNDYNTNATINDGNWHHIAATHDGTSLKVYLDGVQVGTSQAKTFNTTGNQFSIGYRGVASEYFNGSIDEVRVWNVARTAEQINRSKNCELQGNETGLVAYYKFNQGIDQADNTAITTLNATTGSNGTLSNFSLTGTTSNWLAGSPVITGSVIPSNATATSPVTYNLGDTASALSATTGTNGTGLMWYTSATGGTGSTTAPTPSTTTAGSTSYWVASTNANGCESGRIEIIVTVNANATHLNFDGVNDNVAIPATSINNLSQGTIEVWVYPTASILDNQTICAKQSNFENTYAFLSIGGASAANGKVNYQSTNGSSIQSTSTIIPNQWTHIAVAFTSTQAKIYINGVLDNTVSGSFSLPNDTSVTATTIGAILGDGNGQYFTGSIDEFRVWNVALTATDITATMNCEAQMQPELVTYYKFNQGFDNADNAPVLTLNDELGNSNGTLSNFTLTGATSNWRSGSTITTGNACVTLGNSDFENVTSITIYPNPSTGIFNIVSQQNASVEIYDLLGKLVYNQSLVSGTNSIDISNFNAGVYLLKATDANGNSETHKLIKN